MHPSAHVGFDKTELSQPSVNAGQPYRKARQLPVYLSMVASLAAAGPAIAQSDDLLEKSLDELMNIEVRSVARKEQTLANAAAAVHVISNEDIQRSGATTIAEALRMAPGLNVARIDSSRWAISSRGFNDFFANKLLVLMDGRSVYTPLFSGVFWDVQDTMLEDIERIEVIRGPGATLWGANAVNGVINIITKPSTETAGGLVSAGTGTEELGFGSIRYGGRIKENAGYRVYVKYFNRDDFARTDGSDGADEWQMFRTGFRTDWSFAQKSMLTFQGDYYRGEVGQFLTLPTLTPPFGSTPFTMDLIGSGDVEGANLLGRWTHTFSEAADLSLQSYFDRTEREDLVHHEVRNTYDLDFQTRLQAGERQEFMLGLGYRHTRDDLADGTRQTRSIVFEPSERGDDLFSAFLQDEIKIVEDRLILTLGSKFEENDYTGFELQPNARLIWTPHEKHSLWSAVSRAVRTPSRFEHTIRANFNVLPPAAGGPRILQLVGNPNYESEVLTAYEIGYRFLPLERLSFDLAGFYNVYDDLRTIETFPTIRPSNLMEGETYGAEASVIFVINNDWRLMGGYTWLESQLHRKPGTTATTAENIEGDSPRHQFHIRSYLNLPYDLQFDAALYYVDNVRNRGVQAYTRLDLRLGWKPKPNIELSVHGQNLLDDRHREFGPGYLVSPNEIERSVYAKATWKF